MTDVQNYDLILCAIACKNVNENVKRFGNIFVYYPQFFSAGAEEQSQLDVLASDDDKVDKNDAEAADITCAVDTTDVDDDNDEFVEWNEGDGNH